MTMGASGNYVNDQPFTKVRSITPSDVTVYSPPLDAFIPGANGNVAIVDLTGTATTMAVIAGWQYNIAVTKIKSTGTTATGIVGLNW